MTLLELKDVSVQYGRIRAVRDLSFTVEEGEVVSLIGANGAGKTTTMKTISGLLNPSAGSITFDGDDITHTRAHLRVVRGISQSPEGRGVFPGMTVIENLEMGAYARKDRSGIAAELERVFDLFPRLKERRKQVGGTMSGGEQQMLAIGRALMSRPRLLLLDEPSMGLAPQFIRQIFRIVTEINEQGTTVLLVEQNANQALSRSHRAYVLETGEITRTGTGKELLADDAIKEAYLGSA
ncbi:ABC transporter ATP-binding protein [Tersicoccus solisilvae]|uniref:ABC transporter ATP-binding protein n=1 Tax=Tersicoccus solisilvae TaxID=1882339 RepID=A0ABQ1P927_9MICC|nr:ABC transporter ATP-binding protein [Tersicoccus solisilvae]GGC93223.1 ABC transporter ATP-binding protein [Tersicoccus solisilvae]